MPALCQTFREEISMTKTILCLGLAAFALSGCTGRFLGFDKCDSKGAVVWFQEPDKAGQYKADAFQDCKR
jgi:hypothetical protein